MIRHLNRFLTYYRKAAQKDFPDKGEIIVFHKDVLALTNIKYWDFVNTLRYLTKKGYLIKVKHRKYKITDKLINALKSFHPETESYKDVIIYFAYFVNKYMIMDQAEVAKLIKDFYELMKSIDEKLNLILKKLEENEKVSSMQKKGRIGRLVTSEQ